MKKVTLENYRDDKYYPRIVRAVEAILAKGDIVAPIDVFIHMDLLKKDDAEAWRFGRIPYLERVIHCNLAKTSRILRILRMHVHDLNMSPTQTAYVKWGKGRRTPLRFSKTGHPKLEEAYSRHFLRSGLKSKKTREKRETQRPESSGEDSPVVLSKDVHRALFEDAPEPRTLEELKEGVRQYVKYRHGR